MTRQAVTQHLGRLELANLVVTLRRGREKLTHDGLAPGSEMHQAIMRGWPKVLSSLKSLLETGRALPSLW